MSGFRRLFPRLTHFKNRWEFRLSEFPLQKRPRGSLCQGVRPHRYTTTKISLVLCWSKPWLLFRLHRLACQRCSLTMSSGHGRPDLALFLPAFLWLYLSSFIYGRAALSPTSIRPAQCRSWTVSNRFTSLKTRFCRKIGRIILR